jgi:RNA:NAD 2'-phosphotransferase (TPT1/KptA family)
MNDSINWLRNQIKKDIYVEYLNLTINAKSMHDAGCKFYLSANKVWLIDSVPLQYITK